MYLGTPTSRRAKPSIFSLALSILLTTLSAVMSFLYLGLLTLLDIPLALVTLGLIFLYRTRSILDQAPAPTGRGNAVFVDSSKAQLQGLGIILLGGAMIFGPFVLVSYLPVTWVLGGVLGIIMGLSVSQSVFSLWVSRLENRTGMELYFVTGVTEGKGKQLMVKTVEMRRPEPVEA